MKKANATVLSLLLCVLLTLSTLTSAVAAERSGKDIPCIHVRGQAGPILNDAGEDVSYEKKFPEGGLAGMVRECMPLFINALKEDTEEAWDAYREKLIPMVLSTFGPMWLDNNGEATDGTHQAWDWDHGHLTDNKGEDGYDFDSYPFYMDWRLDPFAVADTLHEYILEIKAVTGSDKVNVNARCEASGVLAAYLAKYGYEDFHCIEFYEATLYGADLASVLFSGHFQIDAAALARYKDYKFPIEDDVTNEFVNALVEFTGDTVLLDLAGFSMNLLCAKLYDEVLVPILRQTYATMPAMWAMVGTEDFPAARRNIFKGCEQEYAGLIEKIDRYDREVRQPMDSLLRGAQNAGVKVAVFAKYGEFPIAPIGKNANALSDDLITLKSASMGATTADYGSVLSGKYLQKAKKDGTAKYISPDRMVDASTCLFPDTTWCIYGSLHEEFPRYIFDAMAKFYHSDGSLTVFDDPSLPQYVIAHTDPYNEDVGELEPMTAQNAPVIKVEKRSIRSVDWKEMLLRVFKAVLAFFRQWLKNN